MKEELQGKLVEILTSIQTAAGKASDFAVEQLPDIAQSYVAYGRAYATIQLLAFLLALCAAVYVAIRYGFLNTAAVHGEQHYDPGSWTEGRVMSAVFGSIVSVAVAVVAMVSSGPFLLVWFAPKVWLLKEIASFLK